MLRDRLDARWYPGYENNWDDLRFRSRVLAVLSPTHQLLDLGAGAGIVRAMDFRGQAGRICGVDPDPRVLGNPYLDEAVVGAGDNIDYPDDFFDIVICDNVLEHIECPEKVFCEVNRILKPEGHFLFKTPNRYHYMPLVSRVTPVSIHKTFNRMRGRQRDDTFPTWYRANSVRQIESLAEKTGFSIAHTELLEGRPEYLRFSILTYPFGWLYERLVNSSEVLSTFRIILIGDLKKTGSRRLK